MELMPAERAARDAAAERERELSADHARGQGIVHTPPELARFMARAADDLVRDELGLTRGLSDPALALVDPACGPGAFAAAVAAIKDGRGGGGPSQMYASDRDPRAIELATSRLSGALSAAGLTCSLECSDTLADVLPQTIAARRPNLCVLGNPPWIGRAQLRPCRWLDLLLEDFRRDAHGERLPERKLGVLADAYVRFVRWSCEAARLAPSGAVIALVTNASYLDGPVHRGMRAALRRFFDQILVVDLGGSALLGRMPGRDDNIFGVRPGVAILFGVRGPRRDEQALATVRYARLSGPLAVKLDTLASARLGDLRLAPLCPTEPYQRFVPGPVASDAYARWPSLASAMPFQREGVQTNRDGVVVDVSRAALVDRLRAFAAGQSRPDLEVAWRRLPHYDPERARLAVQRALLRDPTGEAGVLVRPLAYRPFDRRWFAPLSPLCHRPRGELIAAMARSSFALVTVRKDRGDQPYAHFFASRDPIDNCLLSTRSSCRARAFPTHDPSGNENLSPEVASAFAESVGRPIGSVEFACYALATLASATFRRHHDHALHIDYPRIPPPRDGHDFARRVRVGEELVALLAEPLAPEPSQGIAPAASSAIHAFSIGHHRPLDRAGPHGELNDRLTRLSALIAHLPW
jgi:hypothetical protein